MKRTGLKGLGCAAAQALSAVAGLTPAAASEKFGSAAHCSDRDFAVRVTPARRASPNHLRRHRARLGRPSRGAATSVTDSSSHPNQGTAMAPTSGGRIEELFALDHSTMHERVYGRIRDAFTSGQVLPGQRIVIREFARSFGTSMMPVREALRRLEAENALVVTNGRNLAVPIMTASDYQELCLIRVSLEDSLQARRPKTSPRRRSRRRAPLRIRWKTPLTRRTPKPPCG